MGNTIETTLLSEKSDYMNQIAVVMRGARSTQATH